MPAPLQLQGSQTGAFGRPSLDPLLCDLRRPDHPFIKRIWSKEALLREGHMPDTKGPYLLPRYNAEELIHLHGAAHLLCIEQALSRCTLFMVFE